MLKLLTSDAKCLRNLIRLTYDYIPPDDKITKDGTFWLYSAISI